MRAYAIGAFRVIAYLAFLASFAWLFAFVGDFGIPRALRDRTRAKRLAVAARDDYAALGAAETEHRAAVEAWLRGHG